jgi:glycosyltransferase involved in cell wall biosynthesis
MKQKLVRITTVPMSLNKLLEGQLEFMNQHFNVIAISSKDKELRRVGKKENVKTYCVEMTRQITPLKDLHSLIRLYFFLLKEKPEIVHTHTPKAGLLGMIAAFLAGVPIRLHTVAGLPLLETQGIKRQLLDRIEKLTYRLATRIYPNSYELKKIILTNEFISEKRLKVLGNGSSNGIDTNFFNRNKISEKHLVKLKHQFGIQEADFVFIFVGRLVKDKGINELVDAFNKLNQKYKFTKLLLVGPFEPILDPLSIETIQKIEKNTSIIHTGYQEDVRPFYAMSDVLTFPSYREGFPNVVLQAGAMDLPSIVTDINGCNEIITSGFNGEIIPKKDQDALYDMMKAYLKNKELYCRVRSNTRKEIVKKYERSEFLEILLNEYKSLTKEFILYQNS